MNMYDQFLNFLRESVDPERPIQVFEAIPDRPDRMFGVYPNRRYKFTMWSEFLERKIGADIFPDENGDFINGSTLVKGFERCAKEADSSITPCLTLYDCSKTYIPGYVSPTVGEKRNYHIGYGTVIEAHGDNVFELKRNIASHVITEIGHILSGGSGV